MCNLFFYYCDAKEISFYYFRDTKLCAKHEKTREFHLYFWDHVCKVNELCLVDCFHREYKVSNQIIVRDYCIAKRKTFSACGVPLVRTLISERKGYLQFTDAKKSR